jgi:MFS family permease
MAATSPEPTGLHARQVAAIVESDVPARLDRLAFGTFHWLVVAALGITWVLDGLEVTIVGSLGSVLEEPDTLGLSATEVGLTGTAYVAGAIAGALFFGRLTDRYGRKRLFMVTLSLYVVATVLTAFSIDLFTFATCRFLTGMGIGGEYAAINSAIDELIPARVRGFVDLSINGSYWIGAALGAGMTTVLLDPRFLGHRLGWRVAFGLGAILALAIVLVRKWIPESPRWLMIRGRHDEAETIVRGIEARSRVAAGAKDIRSIPILATEHLKVVEVGRVLFSRYRSRAVLGLALMIAQAFFYNAIFFTYALTLTRFYGTKPEHVGSYLLPFALGNFAGPLLLGHLFDRWGRRRMIATTYAASALMLLVTGIAFQQHLLTAKSHAALWSVAFFFGSAAASSAYLTVSEVFPLELRATAISFFYAVGTGAGGLFAPALFGWLIETESREALCAGYVLAATLMGGGAWLAWKLGVDAERRSLEEVAPPLSATAHRT